MIVRQRARSASSPYGGAGASLDWSNPQLADLPGAIFASDTASEQPSSEGEPVAETGTVYSRVRVDVTEADRLLIDDPGRPWKVTGVLSGYTNPYARNSRGSIIKVRRVR